MSIVRALDKLVRSWLTSAKSEAEAWIRLAVFAVVGFCASLLLAVLIKTFAFLIPIFVLVGTALYLWDVYKGDIENGVES